MRWFNSTRSERADRFVHHRVRTTGRRSCRAGRRGQALLAAHLSLSLPTLRRFWLDERGAVVSSELVLLCTVGIAALTAGAKLIQKAIVDELTDIADAIDSLDQSYCYVGYWQHNACSAGSAFLDLDDHCRPCVPARIECPEPQERGPTAPQPTPLPLRSKSTPQVKLRITIDPSVLQPAGAD